MVRALKYSAPQRRRAYELSKTLLDAREITKAQYNKRITNLNKKEKQAREKEEDERFLAQQERIFLRLQKEEDRQQARQVAYESSIRDNFANRNTFTIDMRESRRLGLSDKDILRLIARSSNGKYVITINNINFTLSDRTISRLAELVERNLIIETGNTESDGAFIAELQEANTITASPVRERQQRNRTNGAFFKYNHNTTFDLSRYAIFRDNQIKNYDDTCLVVALRNAGCSEEKLNKVKLFVKNRNIPKSDLQKICDHISIQIRLKTDDNRNSGRNIFGKDYDEIYNIGCLDEHYFIIEPTQITSFAVKNYNDICNEKDFNFIVKQKGKYFERDSSRCISSYDVVKLLIDNKDTLLNEITLEDKYIATTQFYDKVKDEITHLEYDDEKCCRPIKNATGKKSNDYQNVFFDFETNPNGRHIPYLCRTFDGKVHREFIGSDCGLKMLYSLKSNTRLIAHNCTYDFRFIVQYLHAITELARGNRLIGASGMFQDLKIEIKDSYHLISMPLRSFSKVFNLPATKEVMPYTLYTEDNINKRFVPITDAIALLKNEEHNQFYTNLSKWVCKKDDTFDIIKYSSEYCKIDCQILYDGYNIFRRWIQDAFALDIDNILTCASMAHQFFVNEGCYDGVYELGSVPQLFIQGCVVGGRVMTAENQKIYKKDIVNDFDAVSLYPSAMARMDGFLKGKPKVIENLSYEWIKMQDGYFMDIKINSVGLHRKFPLMSLKNENGVRVFSNDMVGKILRVDRYTLEDYIKYHHITFDVIRGYYFDEGFNTTINDKIKYVFNKRLEEKKNKNPVELVYKLIMNSGYGKSIMKPVETESRFFDCYENDDKFDVFLSRNYNWITDYIRFGSKVKVNLVKTLNEHYNIAQVGVCILSNSKRIMNEVMCLAEDNNIELYYQDTDSMHLKNSDIDKLATIFKRTYNRDLIGKSLGQFHSDFDLNGCSNVVATRSIFLGKKCYIDELEGTDSNGNKQVGYHIRMKGIPESSIHYVVEHSKNAEGELRYKNVFELYEDLYQGNAVHFDLTNGGSKANFKFNKDYTIDTLSMFTRKIQFA